MKQISKILSIRTILATTIKVAEEQETQEKKEETEREANLEEGFQSCIALKKNSIADA